MDRAELVSVRKDGKIRVLSRRGKKIYGSKGRVSLTDAQYLVREGYAIADSPGVIRLLSNSMRIKHFVLERDGHVCQYCDKPADSFDCSPLRRRRLPSNCFAACKRCLALKSNMPHDQFVKRFPKDILSEVWSIVDTLSENGIEVGVSIKRRYKRADTRGSVDKD